MIILKNISQNIWWCKIFVVHLHSQKQGNGSVAQLNRVLDYGSSGYRFESCRSHKAAIERLPLLFLCHLLRRPPRWGEGVVSRKSRWSINKLVTPRRGTHEGGERVELLCPDVGVFRCLSFVSERLYSVVVRDIASVGISKAALTKVDRHRIA